MVSVYDGTLKTRVCKIYVDVKTVKGGSLPDIQNTDFTIQFLHNRSDVGSHVFLSNAV
jgi:hypothetical protein